MFEHYIKFTISKIDPNRKTWRRGFLACHDAECFIWLNEFGDFYSLITVNKRIIYGSTSINIRS